MSVKSVDYKANLAASTIRGPSRVIWADCPIPDMLEDGGKGMYLFDDFMKVGNTDMSSAVAGSLAGWSVYGYAGAQLNDGQLEGGVIKIGSNGDNEGVALLSSSGAFRFITTSTLALNQKMWFECRWRRSSVTTAIADHFIGLMGPTLSSGLPAAAQPITTTDDTLMTAGNFFGFHSTATTGVRGGPTEVAVAFELTSGTINYPTNLTTLMASSGNSVLTASSFVKTGFLFDPNAVPKIVTAPTARQTTGSVRRPIIRFFVNGLELPTFLTTEDIQNATSGQAFPTAFMTPVMAVMNTAGSATNTLDIDWIACAQLANS